MVVGFSVDAVGGDGLLPHIGEHGAPGDAQDLRRFIDGDPFSGHDLDGIPEFSDFTLDVVELLFEFVESFVVDVDELHGCSFLMDQMQWQWSDSPPRTFIE